MSSKKNLLSLVFLCFVSVVSGADMFKPDFDVKDLKIVEVKQSQHGNYIVNVEFYGKNREKGDKDAECLIYPLDRFGNWSNRWGRFTSVTEIEVKPYKYRKYTGRVVLPAKGVDGGGIDGIGIAFRGRASGIGGRDRELVGFLTAKFDDME